MPVEHEVESPSPPQPFSDRMEHRLALEEARTTKRTRIRKAPCVMPQCGSEVHRSNQFPLCINHLLLVWKLVDSGQSVSEWSKRNGNWLERVDAKHVMTADEAEAQRLAARQRQREIATTAGSLYVLDTGNDTVKIGWTKRHLFERLDEYPPHFRLIVSISGTRADERDVHRSLKIFRAAKHEWYHVKSEVARQINAWIAIHNVAEIRAAKASEARFAHANPDKSFEPKLLPRFTTLAEWDPDGKHDAREDRRVTAPAPQSRSGARRVG